MTHQRNLKAARHAGRELYRAGLGFDWDTENWLVNESGFSLKERVEYREGYHEEKQATEAYLERFTEYVSD